ncbi:MAG: hypothetical protein WC725_04970 [Patescibacteria group bacterium]|jgi:hypothetical protein
MVEKISFRVTFVDPDYRTSELEEKMHELFANADDKTGMAVKINIEEIFGHIPSIIDPHCNDTPSLRTFVVDDVIMNYFSQEPIDLDTTKGKSFYIHTCEALQQYQQRDADWEGIEPYVKKAFEESAFKI